MRCILGIDGGGSKCNALLARDDGQAIGWGRSDQMEDDERLHVFGGRGRSYYAILRAVMQALDNVPCSELHIASVTHALPLDFLKEGPATMIQVHPTSEYTAAFRQAGEQTGVVALAGTGAVVYAERRDGRYRYLDGLGPLLGDHGGGYEIGLRAVRAAAQSGWHPRHAASFAREVIRRCGGKERDPGGLSLIDYGITRRDRSEIALMAKLVLEAAEAGDSVACRILRETAEDLGETVHDAVDGLQMTADDYAFVGTGGIITHSQIYWDHLCRCVLAFAPRFRPMRPDLPAVVGVTLCALAGLRDVDYTKARHRLCESTRAMIKARSVPE